MANLACKAVCPLEEPSPEHGSTADACPQGNHQDIFGSKARPEAVLRPAGRGGVVDYNGYRTWVPAAGQLRSEVDAVNPVEVGAESCGAPTVDHPRATHAERHGERVADPAGRPAAAARTVSITSSASVGVGSLS
jgi:hypothetical protein